MEQSHGQVLTINTLIFGIIATCVVTLRIGFRIKSRKTSASDLFLAIALFSSVAQDAFNAACVTQWGYGHHKQDLAEPIRSSPVPLKLLWLNQVFFKLTTLSSKLAICIVYHDIFQRANSKLIRATRVVITATAILIIGYYGAAFFVSVFQCTPISKSWLPKKLGGTCIDLIKFRYYTAAANIITSVLLISTPLPALYKMRQTRPEVSELMGLILLGLVHTGCTIARLVLMIYPDPATKKDPQYTSVPPLTIAIIEMDIGIIAASLIVMRPCFQAMSKAFGEFYSNNSRVSVRSTQSSSHAKSSGTGSWNDGKNNILCTFDFGVESDSKPPTAHDSSTATASSRTFV